MTSPDSGATSPGRASLPGALRSEWTKLWSVRSTAWSLAAMVVITIGIGALVTLGDRHNQAFSDPTSASLSGLLLGQLAIGVLGVLVISAEYGTGTIRATFSAQPRRGVVLLAKILVFGVVALVIGEVVCFASFFVGQAILSGAVPTATLGQPGVLRAVIGGGGYLAVLGLLALGFGAILRHTAGAITLFVAILLVLPLIATSLPSSWQDDIVRFLPADIGVVLLSTSPVNGGHEFAPITGLIVLAIYAIAALGLGALLLERRDA